VKGVKAELVRDEQPDKDAADQADGEAEILMKEKVFFRIRRRKANLR